MSTTYSIEHAKSARSACKKCKVKIEKDELRLGKSAPGPSDFNVQSWYHVGCLPFPRQLKNEGVTVESFVTDILEDNTEEQILQTKAEEIIGMIKATKPKAKKSSGDGDDGSKVAKIKARIEAARAEQEAEEPPKKKSKTLTEEEEGEMEVFALYGNKKNEELKDILRWNNEYTSGTKNFLLARVIDGHMHGKLDKCHSCELGKLKIEDDTGEKVVCGGYFDEDMQQRVPCSFKCKTLDAPRVKELPNVPVWFTEEPTEEQKEAIEAAKDGVNTEDDEDTAQLIKLAEDLEWNLDSKEGIKKATKDLIELCTTSDGPKVDIPQDATMSVGKIVAGNKSSDAAEVLRLVIKKFGFSKQNEEKAKKKSEAAEESCAVPANAAIFEVICELRDLYFKESNRNAGMSYSKASTAIKDLDFEITEDNAKKLGKPGKMKVDGIGKGTADKIYEFITTGKIEKLEEKRAAAE